MKTNELALAGLTVMELVVAEVTEALVVSEATMVYGEPEVEVICRPLKLATPLTAATVVVPAAKLPDDSVTLSESVDPVLPVVMGLP